MMPIRGITVCHGYDDLLALTLPRNARHLSEILVVTSAEDYRTKEVVASVSNCRCFETDAFWRHGAKFNKGLALEEAFDVLVRNGWILVLDADTLLPDNWNVDDLKSDTLYGAPRHIVNNPKDWHEGLDWQKVTTVRDLVFPGYFHLFHADDPHLVSRPWYDCTFTHAGGGDGYFQSRWPRSNKVWLPQKVLHLGPKDTNWFGKNSSRLDDGEIVRAAENKMLMEQFKLFKGWIKGGVRPKKFTERVTVPGHRALEWVYKPGQ